jgi:polysaccharide export outer membrane protein
LTLTEAARAIKSHLAESVKNPDVVLQLHRSLEMPPINGDFQVAPDGTINLKSHGVVRVAGKSLVGAKKAIEKHLSKRLASPRVAVDVGGYHSKAYYIVANGQGKGANWVGRIPLTGNETVLDALAQIPGLKDATRKKIMLARLGEDGKSASSLIALNWEKSGETLEHNYQILPGDRVLVLDVELTAPAVKPPHEGQMTSLPTYKIEAPDVVEIKLARMAPLNYRLGKDDEVRIGIAVSQRGRTWVHECAVADDGTVDLRNPYGSFFVRNLTTDQAETAIEKKLSEKIESPKVSVQWVRSATLKPIDGPYLVGPDGTINLRSYGSVAIAGMTVVEAKKALEKHLSKQLKSPEVSIDVASFNSKVYYIITEGAGQGDNIVRAPITGNETVLDALAQIQGLAPGGPRKKDIWVVRPGPNGMIEPKILPVDFNAIIVGDTATNYQVMPGDRLYIGKYDRRKWRR